MTFIDFFGQVKKSSAVRSRALAKPEAGIELRCLCLEAHFCDTIITAVLYDELQRFDDDEGDHDQDKAWDDDGDDDGDDDDDDEEEEEEEEDEEEMRRRTRRRTMPRCRHRHRHHRRRQRRCWLYAI